MAQHVEIKLDHVQLNGELSLPEGSGGLVIFAHGSGSSRLSPRNLEVAEALNDDGLATLLFDLLTPAEAADRANVFDIPLLGDRLVAVTNWVKDLDDVGKLPIGYFGASTGAGAALLAAADLGDQVSAVVSRGGRPDLAAPRLGEVNAPTLTDSWWQRPPGDRTQSPSRPIDELRARTLNRPRSDPSVRGAGNARTGLHSCKKLVPASSRRSHRRVGYWLFSSRVLNAFGQAAVTTDIAVLATYTDIDGVDITAISDLAMCLRIDTCDSAISEHVLGTVTKLNLYLSLVHKIGLLLDVVIVKPGLKPGWDNQCVYTKCGHTQLFTNLAKTVTLTKCIDIRDCIALTVYYFFNLFTQTDSLPLFLHQSCSSY